MFLTKRGALMSFSGFKGHARGGFSLIEIMVYLSIVGVLTVTVLGVVRTLRQNAKNSTTKTNLRTTKFAVDSYYTDEHKYPQDLKVLVKKGMIEDSILVDGWEQPIKYKITQGQKRPYELYSYGGSEGSQEPKEKRIDAWKE
jgi:prepilin-type N-terminal cleavage/methylation domain-containing protein